MSFTSLPCYSLPSNLFRIINGYTKPITNTNINNTYDIVPYNLPIFMIIFNMDH
jgi:hypothetical protein